MGKPKSRGNGEGTIFKRERNGKTLWVAEYTTNAKNPVTGKREIITKYAKTRTEAKDKLAEIITKLNTNTYVDKSKITLKEIAEEYIDKSYRLNKLKESSYDRKKITLNQICNHYIGNMEMQKITEKDIENFLESITEYSNSTIGKIYGLLFNTFQIAVRKRILPYNILDNNLDLPKPISNKKNKKIVSLTVEEQKQFINAVTNDNSFIYTYQLLLSLFTGMRMGEINALDVDDVDFKNKIIHIRRTITRGVDRRAKIGAYTKTKSGIRDIVMNKQVEKILKKYKDTNYIENDLHLFFCSSKKSCISTDTVNMIFKKICKKYNIGKGYDMNQHMLRHTFATRCIESGMPSNVLSKIMGHANISTTLDIYCDVFDKYEKKIQRYNLLLLRKKWLDCKFIMTVFSTVISTVTPLYF